MYTFGPSLPAPLVGEMETAEGGRSWRAGREAQHRALGFLALHTLEEGQCVSPGATTASTG